MRELDYKKILIVVDMVNGFIREGIMSDKYIEHIIEPQIKLIEKINNNKEGLIFVKEAHSDNSNEFNRYPKHCVKGTSEAELVDELKIYENNAIVFEKNSTSTIFSNGFLSLINKMKNLEEVIIVGCCTDICVMNLAIPLQNYFDEINRNVKIVIPKDCVETYDGDNHNREEYNNIAFKLLEQTGVKVVDKYDK